MGESSEMGMLGSPTARIRDIQPGDNERVRIVFDQVQPREITGRIDDGDVRRLLLAAMKDPTDPAIRVDSVEVLTRQSGDDIRDALIFSVRHDTNAAVRLKALEGLRRFAGDPSARDTLKFVLEHDDNAEVRSEAIDVLAPANQVVTVSPDLAGTLEKLVRSAGRRRIRSHALYAALARDEGLSGYLLTAPEQSSFRFARQNLRSTMAVAARRSSEERGGSMRVSILLSALFAAILTGNIGAQSIDHVLQFATEVQPGGSYLGVKLADIDADRAKTLKLADERGVEVKNVQEGSPAETAGIRAEDVILTYNGENVLGAQQFVRLVQETPQARKIKIQLWRDGKTQTVTVITGAPPARYFSSPSTFVGLPMMPEMQYFSTTDIPSPLLVWKNLTLGIEFEHVDSQLAQYFGVTGGVLIRSVDKGSPGEKAGLKSGDVIVSVGHKNLQTARDLTAYLRQPGSSVPVSLMRDHKRMDLTIALPSDQQ